MTWVIVLIVIVVFLVSYRTQEYDEWKKNNDI